MVFLACEDLFRLKNMSNTVWTFWSIKRSHILKKTYNLRVSLNTCDLLLNTNAHGHFSTMTSGLKRLLVYLVFQSKTSKIFLNQIVKIYLKCCTTFSDISNKNTSCRILRLMTFNYCEAEPCISLEYSNTKPTTAINVVNNSCC